MVCYHDRDIFGNSRNATDQEESILLQYILILTAKGFSPRMSFVEYMANRLRVERDLLHGAEVRVSSQLS